jgi:nucleotide-binding universal stress UspA family protein
VTGKFSKVLVAIDGSEFSIHAAEYAISIAKKSDGLLIALHVLPTGIRYEYFQYNLEEIPLAIKEILILYQNEIECMSNKIKDMCKQEEVKFKTDIVNISSSVAGAIVSYAEGEKVELIVIGTRGRSGIKNMLIGSVATDVVNYAHCPVMVVR